MKQKVLEVLQTAYSQLSSQKLAIEKPMDYVKVDAQLMLIGQLNEIISKLEEPKEVEKEPKSKK